MRKINYDPSGDSGILITCPDCPYWYSFRENRIDAYRSGEAHQVRVHDVEPERAARARVLYERRHAD
jgi:hypothetical protein